MSIKTCLIVPAIASTLFSCTAVFASSHGDMLKHFHYNTERSVDGDFCELNAVVTVSDDLKSVKLYYYVEDNNKAMFSEGTADIQNHVAKILLPIDIYPTGFENTLYLSIDEDAVPFYHTTFTLPVNQHVRQADYDEKYNYYFNRIEYDQEGGEQILSYSGVVGDAESLPLSLSSPVALMSTDSMVIENGNFMVKKKYRYEYIDQCD